MTRPRAVRYPKVVSSQSWLLRGIVLAACLGVMEAADRLRTLDDSHLGRGSGPISLALDPTGRDLYVAHFNTSELQKLDAADGTVRARLTIPDREEKFRLVPIRVTWSQALGLPLVACHRWGGVFAAHFESEPPWMDVLEPGLKHGPFDEVKATIDQESVLAMGDGLDGELLVVFGQVQTEIIGLRVAAYRRESAWREVRTSDVVSLAPRGYHRGEWPIAVSARRRRVYLAEPGTGRLMELDGDLKLLRNGQVGIYPSSMIMDDDHGLLYVADSKIGAVSAVNVETLVAERVVPVGAGAVDLAFDRSRDLLWVATEREDAVIALGIPSLEERERRTGLTRPSSLALSPDGSRLWVAELGAGRVSAISTAPGSPVPAIVRSPSR